jgi:hypothetical protein
MIYFLACSNIFLEIKSQSTTIDRQSAAGCDKVTIIVEEGEGTMYNTRRMNQKEIPRRAEQPSVKQVKLKRTRKQWLDLFRRARDIAQTTRTYDFAESK